MTKPRKKSLKEMIIGKFAERMTIVIKDPPVIARADKTLKDSRVALVTTAGVHLISDRPFDTTGDHTFRVIPGDADFHDLTITHTHYDTREAMKDKNCVFPLEILRVLARDGSIKDVAPRHFGLMGYIPDTGRLMSESAPRIADLLAEDEVDIVLLSPG